MLMDNRFRGQVHELLCISHVINYVNTGSLLPMTAVA